MTINETYIFIMLHHRFDIISLQKIILLKPKGMNLTFKAFNI